MFKLIYYKSIFYPIINFNRQWGDSNFNKIGEHCAKQINESFDEVFKCANSNEGLMH